jgi:hypothetical protein
MTDLGDLPDEPRAIEILSCGGKLVRKRVSHVEDCSCLARFVGRHRRPVPPTEHLGDLSDYFLRKRIVLGDQVRHVSTSLFKESAKAPWTRTIVGRIKLSSRLVMPCTSLGRAREELFEAGGAYYVGRGPTPILYAGRRVQPERRAQPGRWRS